LVVPSECINVTTLNIYEACATETHSRMLGHEGIATVRLDHHRHLDGSRFDAQVGISYLKRITWASAFQRNTASCLSPSYVNIWHVGAFLMFRDVKITSKLCEGYH
jgi:hypothetical protein